jgi:eukaryotic-like serine/threonine-protein kinase
VDIYALGMVAFTLLTGRAYWADEARAGGVFALVATVAGGPEEPACTRAARRGVQLHPAFDAWFARMTAPDPARRFATATEGVEALAAALSIPMPSHSGTIKPVAGPLLPGLETWRATPSTPPAPSRPASRSGTIGSTLRALDERTQVLAETTMGPAVHPAETPGQGAAPVNRKKVVAGIVCALALGVVIGGALRPQGNPPDATGAPAATEKAQAAGRPAPPGLAVPAVDRPLARSASATLPSAGPPASASGAAPSVAVAGSREGAAVQPASNSRAAAGVRSASSSTAAPRSTSSSGHRPKVYSRE